MRKAVFTYWNPKGDAAGYRNHDEMAASLILSVEYAKKHFEQVELYTDNSGYALLIEKYNIGFTEAHTNLQVLNGAVSPEHFAFAKIYTCHLQTEPFVHIDNDFILWQQLPSEILNAPLFFQSPDYPHRADQYKLMLEMEGENVPQLIRDNASLTSWNFGIMGFNDLSMIYEWYNAVLEYLSNIKDDEKTQRQTPSVNMLFEQYFLSCLIHRDKTDVKALAINLDKIEHPEIAFTHLWGDCKKNPELMERVSARLQKDFPEIHQTIFKTDKTFA